MFVCIRTTTLITTEGYRLTIRPTGVDNMTHTRDHSTLRRISLQRSSARQTRTVFIVANVPNVLRATKRPATAHLAIPAQTVVSLNITYSL